MGCVVGADVGSQSVKAVVLDAAGAALATASAPCAMRHPAGGWAEQDPGDWTEALAFAVREACGRAGVGGDDVAGHNLTNGTQGITPIDRIPLGPTPLGPFDFAPKYAIFVGIAAVVIFVSLRLRRGRLGRAWLAIREDELAASMMGVPLMKTKLYAYGIGAVAGGLGGVAFGVARNEACVQDTARGFCDHGERCRRADAHAPAHGVGRDGAGAHRR